MSSITTPAPTVDIRRLGACADRKALVLATFDALGLGEKLLVVNDHMPHGLRKHFEEHRPDAFAWVALDQGPGAFRVEITKTA
jgi:uncharacterized protein (DUF2249 family)